MQAHIKGYRINSIFTERSGGAFLSAKSDMDYRYMPAVLSIAGSDSSGGAGIQADIKSIEANGCYALTAITALTAQNTVSVRAISNVTPEFLREQLDACFDDIEINAVKIGMVSDKELISVIADVLIQRNVKNIIVDPVMVSTSGSKLLMDDALDCLKEKLIPIALLITPNIPEAELLSGIKIENKDDMIKAGKILTEMYHTSVLVKGGHNINDANDILFMDNETFLIEGEKIDNENTHGTGCTLSSSIAAYVARGYDLKSAIVKAKEYISGALKNGINLGQASGPLNHIWNMGLNKKLYKLLAKGLTLYGVTDGITVGEVLYNKVEEAIKGGMTMFELREKNVTDEQYLKDALAIKELTDRYNIPLIINDNVEVARLSDADGVHLGQDDMSVDVARSILGHEKIIGVTAHSVEEAIKAERLGADYLGVGAVFKTATKADTTPITYEILRDICNSVSIPVVAISGINEENVLSLKGSGISGVAVSSAIFANDDVCLATEKLKEKTIKMLMEK